MKTKQISVQEYALKINPSYFRVNKKNPNAQLSKQAIKYRINNNLFLPEVIKYNRVGKVHVLSVRHDF